MSERRKLFLLVDLENFYLKVSMEGYNDLAVRTDTHRSSLAAIETIVGPLISEEHRAQAFESTGAVIDKLHSRRLTQDLTCQADKVYDCDCGGGASTGARNCD